MNQPMKMSACAMPAPGRLRVAVPALYRSPEVQRSIESRRTHCRLILAVHANPLTARVLILFEAQAEPQDILRILGLTEQQAASPAAALPDTGVAARPALPDRNIYPDWHLANADAALDFHGSSLLRGLPATVAVHRLQQGSNVLPLAQRRPAMATLLAQFNSLPVLLLGVSAVLSLATGGLGEALVIGAVLLANGAIGFVTERRAEAAIASLEDLSDPRVAVLRDAKLALIDAADLVPGDVLPLIAGQRVAADARLLRASGLAVDESALTGESMPRPKDTLTLVMPAPLAERNNMIYRGTSVVAGSGLAVVVGTGSRTEIGAIGALMAETVHPQTPIQKQLDRLGNQLVGLSGAVCIAVFGIGLLRGYGWLAMLKSSISLAIAAVPEGLPTVATSSLARGIGVMRRRAILVRRLQAVETIGAIQVICLDKTGTLTVNRMAAVAIQTQSHSFLLDDPQNPASISPLPVTPDAELERLLQICILCNETSPHEGNAHSDQNGSATENALLALAVSAGLAVSGVRADFPLLSTELRAEGRNYMRTEHRQDQGDVLLSAIKGSPLEVLSLCAACLENGEVMALDAERRRRIAEQNAGMAQRQLRVLGFAYAQGRPEQDRPLVWVGLVGLADPLRHGLPQVITRFHAAGIRTVMLTGDQAGTAEAIGESLRLNRGQPLRIVNADNIEQMSEQALADISAQADIFARVSPAHKLRIVQALQRNGQVVAMTGDGINDGPALRAADIGIAMGHGGTDLARSAADMVLENDSLESLLEAIAQGRGIATNIGKSLHFLISSNLSEILVVLGAIGSGAGHPLSPMQLLWINLLSDVWPAIALAAEPAEDDVMQAAPREPGTPLVGRRELRRYAREGVLLAGGALAAYFYGLRRYGAGPQASGMAFNSLMLGQLLHAASCRSDRHGLFAAGGNGRNRQLDLALAGSFGLQVLANLVPGLRRLLGISPMGVGDVLVTLGSAALPALWNDALKSKRRPGPVQRVQ